MSNSDLEFANMSDDDFAKAIVNSESIVQEPLDGAPVVSDDAVDPTIDHTVNSADNASDELPVEPEPDSVVIEPDDASTDDPEGATVTPEPEAEKEATDAIDPIQELYAPFKASGSEMSVKSVAEARQLMQMGVDYQNKMSGFKPHRKTIKTLQNNDIDEAKLSYLIDLSKGNPDAIAKLFKEHDINVHDINTEEDSSYVPSDYSVSDTEVDLDDVLTELRGTQSFATTQDVIANRWDDSSKRAILGKPQLIRNLNAHVANGTYDLIMQEVNRAKIFGGLQGLSDLDAYNHVGEQMRKDGAFAQPTATPAPVIKTKPVASNTNTDRKLRTSTSKRAPSPVKQNQFDYAGMSDAAFEKLLKE